MLPALKTIKNRANDTALDFRLEMIVDAAIAKTEYHGAVYHWFRDT